MKRIDMKSNFILIFCVFFAAPVVAISLSVVSEFNAYAQIYDAFGAIIAADFVYADKILQANSGIVQLDRLRFIGQDKKIYEYRFDTMSLSEKVIFQFHKDNTCSIGRTEQNGMVTPLSSHFQAAILYE